MTPAAAHHIQVAYPYLYSVTGRKSENKYRVDSYMYVFFVDRTIKVFLNIFKLLHLRFLGRRFEPLIGKNCHGSLWLRQVYRFINANEPHQKH